MNCDYAFEEPKEVQYRERVKFSIADRRRSLKYVGDETGSDH